MKNFVSPLALAATAALAVVPRAHAHGDAGEHVFISTLLIDDADVADEAALPTFIYLPQPAGDGPAGANYVLNFELDKRITENFGFALNYGYTWLTQPGNKTANGWNDLALTLKDNVFVNDPHEALFSIGVTRVFSRTGATGTNGALLENDASSSTIPTFYFAKGFGDVPVPLLRPLALTGEIGYQIADQKLKVDPVTGQENNGIANSWLGGLSLQYSLLYLSSQVKDYGLPAFVNHLTPVAELAWSSPASKPNDSAVTYLWGVGMNYTATDYSLGVEVLIPGNKATGSHLGVVAQFHLFFDDRFPHSLSKPIVDWF